MIPRDSVARRPPRASPARPATRRRIWPSRYRAPPSRIPRDATRFSPFELIPRVTSSWGREQQINRFPAAAGSSGSGSYFTDPDINPHSQVWQTPARQDQRTGTSQASASSSRLWNFESQETVSPARANETLGLSPYESVGGCGRHRLGKLVLAPHHEADGQAAPLQRLHDEAAHAANPARGGRDKNGVRHRSALPASHRQHDPEARLAAHHAVVGLGGPFQGVHFVHRTDTGLDAERQRVLRVDGRAGVPALDGPAAPDEQERGGLE